MSPQGRTDTLGSQHPGDDCKEEIYLDVKGDAAQSDADDSHCDQGLKSCGPPPPPPGAQHRQHYSGITQPSSAKPKSYEESGILKFLDYKVI